MCFTFSYVMGPLSPAYGGETLLLYYLALTWPNRYGYALLLAMINYDRWLLSSSNRSRGNGASGSYCARGIYWQIALSASTIELDMHRANVPNITCIMSLSLHCANHTSSIKLSFHVT